MLGDATLSQKFAAAMLEKGRYVIGFLLSRCAARGGAGPHPGFRRDSRKIWNLP